VITIARLIMVPALIVAIGHKGWGLAFILFVIAGISDAVDGFIARRFDMRSEFGAYLDPFADKALLVSIYVALAVVGVLPGWLAVTVVSRDVMIVAAIILSWLMRRPVEIKPLFISKINTTVQIAFAALVLGMLAFDVHPEQLVLPAMVLVAALTIISAGAYLGRWLRHMAA
jgi:cardiolipin synthase